MKNLFYTALGIFGIIGALSLGIVNASDYVTTIPGLVVTGEQDGQVFEYGVLKFDDGSGHVITLLDRNLGATENDITSTGSYGYHYQWGNNHGFEQGCIITMQYGSCNDAVTDNSTRTNVDWNLNYDNSNYSGILFIRSYYDYWSGGLHYDGLRGGSGDNKDNNWGLNTITLSNITNRQGPCPKGYHVPSAGERSSLIKYRAAVYTGEGNNITLNTNTLNSFDITDEIAMEQFQQSFKIPFAGYRYNIDARLRSLDDAAYLWTSSPSIPISSTASPDPFTFNISTGGYVYFSNAWRTFGESIRCFSNDYLFPYHFLLMNEDGELMSGSIISGEKLANVINFDNIEISGYTVDYWYLDGEDVPFDITGTTITGDITLYAKLTPVEYEITYDLGGGIESRTNPTRYTVESGTFGLYQPIKTGYMFLGWTGSNGTEPNANIYITGGSTGTRAYNAVWGSFEDINAYFISDTGAVSYITLMDRNMGASMTGAGPDASTGSYGFHYQWGNNYGFSVLGNVYAGTYNDFKVGWNAGYENKGYNGSIFIKGSPYYDYWVGNNHYDGLWGGSGDAQDNDRGLNTITSENIINRQGPCPDGYHVPSAGEWDKLLIFWIASYSSGSSELNTGDGGLKYLGNESLITSFYNDFSISFAGSRFTNDAVLKDQIFSTVFWTSSPYSSNYPRRARDFYIKSDNLNVGSYDGRSYGLSLRCFSNDYLFTQSSMTIHPNGGTGAMVLVEGDNIKSLGTPKKTNSVFEGWYDADSEGNKIETGSSTPTNLYARWSCASGYVENNSGTGCIELYTITYELNDGVLSGNNATGYTIESETITLINPTKTGYTFTGRSGTELNSLTTSVTIPTGSTGDREYEANWEINQYTITFKDGDNEITSITADYGTGITPPANPTKNGYTFKGWEPEIPSTMPAEDLDIKAIWDRNGSSGGGGGGGGGGGSSSSNTGSATSQTGSQIDSNTGSTASGTNEKEPEGTGNNAEIQTGSQVDPQPDEETSEQLPQNVDKDIQDSSDNTSEGQNYSEEFQQAYEFAKGKGITTMPTIQKANMNGPLTRIAMAKMLSQYAINVLGQKAENTVVPKFNDVTDKQNSDYDYGITLAYQLGIMGQNMPNNNFRPTDEVTRAEFATALSRMLYNTSDGEYKSTSKYYTHHMEKLKEEGIITKDDPAMKELRGYVMIMLMRSAK